MAILSRKGLFLEDDKASKIHGAHKKRKKTYSSSKDNSDAGGIDECI